ncbi:MAG: enoyl-CoA hydratase/isomerase family protein [Thermocrispum sp.]
MGEFDGLGLRTLSLERLEGDVLILRMNRPDRLNSQTVRMFHEYGIVARALRDVDARAMIVTGAGDKAFCAGFDTAEIDVLTSMGTLEFVSFMETASAGVSGLRQLPFPLIAAVNGPASGGGMSLALACDVRLATPTVKFNLAFIKVGLSVGELGTTWTLPRLIGLGRACELAFTGRTVRAEEAERIGLVNRIVPAASLLDDALALIADISRNSPGGIRLSKTALLRSQESGAYTSAAEMENRGQALLTRTTDMAEAVAAKAQQRAPVFDAQGR